MHVCRRLLLCRHLLHHLYRCLLLCRHLLHHLYRYLLHPLRRRLRYQRPITVLSPTYSPQTVSNPGFSDVSTLVGGFVRGWYEGVFWRVIGASPNQYVVGGTPSAPVQFSTEGLAQGFANTRV
ncbi:hypothetical protein BC829DRAFT_393394, partial [Chytridium lagenaria]